MILPALLVLAGCGNSRIPVPSLKRPLAPGGFQSLVLPSARIGLMVPRDWPVETLRGPMLAVISSGPAIISVWRYPGAPVPSGPPSVLAGARDALLHAAAGRDPHISVVRSSLVRIDGYDAIELDTLQRLGGRLRRVRSVHVYLPGEEVVLEEYAPLALFHGIDHVVFSPVRRSLHVLAGGSA